MSTSSRKRLNVGVFVPAFTIILLAVVLGLVDNAALVRVAKGIFYFSLVDFAWLYQLLAISALAVTAYSFFSKAGDIRLGGAHAKPAFSMATTFAMALTVSVAEKRRRG